MILVFKQGFRITKNVAYFHAKRTMDIIISLIIAGSYLSAMLIAMLAVKLTSKGPIFFKQKRIGEKEIPFTLLKLRTMEVGSDKKGDYTQENDPRITSIGNFLRKSRLDELPQLLNVIKGDMSLIGLRAEWDKLVETYEKKYLFTICVIFLSLASPAGRRLIIHMERTLKIQLIIS